MEVDHWEQAFAENEYLILESVLTEPLRTVAHEYAIKRALVSRETTSAGAAPGTPSFYGDPLMDTLLDLLQSVAWFTGRRCPDVPPILRRRARRDVNPHTHRPAADRARRSVVRRPVPGPFVSTRHGFRRRPAPVTAALYRQRVPPPARRVDNEHHGAGILHSLARVTRRMEVRQAAVEVDIEALGTLLRRAAR
jgi:hypothetical protein